MSCVAPAKSLATSAACCSFVRLFGAVGVVAMTAGAAHANDPATTPAGAWCVVRSDAQPECLYDNLVTCGLNAMRTGGQCGKADWSVVPAATTAVVPPRPRRKPPQRPQTAAKQNDNKQNDNKQNDKLFREFERWKESGK